MASARRLAYPAAIPNTLLSFWLAWRSASRLRSASEVASGALCPPPDPVRRMFEGATSPARRSAEVVRRCQDGMIGAG